MQNAFDKLIEVGMDIRFPHVSRVMGADRIWELRPRAGRSRSRALFRVVGGAFMIVAIGPEAGIDRRGFSRAVARAEGRLAEEER